MAMFDKPIVNADGTTSPGTVVGANVKLTGTLKDVNDITVHGSVEGEIISDRIVTIAETAKVKGPITATSVTIAGTVNGAVTASEHIELLPSARVNGSITTTDLSIKSGALFNGKATMNETNRSDKTESMTAADSVEMTSEATTQSDNAPTDSVSQSSSDSEESVHSSTPDAPSVTSTTAELED